MILHLPIGPRGENGLPGKQGPDDFIVRYGEQAFRDFIESAVNHRPVVRSLAEYRAEMVAARLDSIAHPGIYCDRSPAGAGKSFADRPAAAAAKSSLIVLPTHRNCTEVVGDYLLDGLDAKAYPQLTQQTCVNYDEAIRAIQSGLSPSGALCPTCPTHMTCPYHAEMEEAGEAAHRMATHQRARLTFSTIADICKYLAIHEDAINLIRPTAEIDAGFDKVAVVARDAKEAARTREDVDSVHFFERMENAACIVSEHLQQAASTAPLILPAASTAPRGVDLHLLAAMRATKTWPPADAVRITKAAASGDAELVLRVDPILTKGRELAVRRSVIAVWATKIPDHAACWFCDATANADELQTVLGRPVADRTPVGQLEQLHQAVQVTTDIKKSTAPSTVLKVLRGILAAFPEAKRIGVITHPEHLPIIRGTAKNPEHRLDESLRGRIVRTEYFRSGEGRGSNHWIEECDLLVVLGTPRVPPPAVKLRLIQLGLVNAATREGGWEADWWSGKTTTGIHEVLLTHSHFDHFAQLDWLSMCLLRSGRSDQPCPLPIYASPECWENGPNRVHRYLAERSDFRPLQPGIAVVLGNFVVTPFAVDHGPKAPGAVGFVLQHGNRKIVITGDFLRVPEEDNPLLFDADVMFLDANTWHPAEGAWHQSVLGNLRLIDKWRPKRAYMIHYSGYEDREHTGDPVSSPLSQEQLRHELQCVTGDRDIRPAEHGMVLGDTVPWPE